MDSVQQNNKRIAKNAILLYIRMFLMMAISLYTSRIILKTLGVVDFGILNAVGGVTAMLSFITNSMSEATQRFIIFEQGKPSGNPNKVFCQCINSHFLCAIAIILFLETFGMYFLHTKMVIPAERFNTACWVFHISVMTIFVSIMSVPYTATIIAHEKMSAFAYISLLEVGMKLLIVIVVAWLSYDKLILFSFLWFINTIMIRNVYNIYCRKHFAETKFKLCFDKDLFTKMLKFAFWNIYGNLADMINTQGLNILLNTFFGPVVNAARAIAVQIQGSVRNFCVNFQMAINPQITKKYAEGDIKYMQSLVFKSSKFSFFLLLLIVSPILFGTGMLLHLWLGDTIPDHTITFVQITLMIMMINVFSDPLNISISATGKLRKPMLWISSVAMLSLPISYICAKSNMCAESILYTILFTESLTQITRLILTHKTTGLDLMLYIREVIIRSLIVVILSFSIPLAFTLYFPSNIYLTVITMITSELCVLIFIISIGLNKSERKLISEYIKCKLLSRQ